MNVNKLTNEARMVMAVLGLKHPDQLIAWDVDSIVEDIKLHREAFLRERHDSPRPPTSLTTLVQQWRAKSFEISGYHATMGMGWDVCADQLEAFLKSSALGSPQPPSEARQIIEEVLQRIESGRKGSIGSIDNVYMPVIDVAEVTRWRGRVAPPHSPGEK